MARAPRQIRPSLFGQVRPTAAQPDVAGRALQDLAATASNITGQFMQRQAAATGQREGLEAGQQVDEEGRPVAPELASALTTRGQAFNQAAIATFQSQMRLDTRKRLNELALKHENDPAGFQENAQKHLQGTLEGLPPELAAGVRNDMQISITGHAERIDKQYKAKLREESQAVIEDDIASTMDTYLNHIRAGETEQAQAELVSFNQRMNAHVLSGDLPIKRKLAVDRELEDRKAQQETLKDINNIVFDEALTPEQRLEKGEAFLKGLRDRTVEDLSPEQKDSLVKVVEAKVNDVRREIAGRKTKRTIEQEKQVSNLKVAANLGLGDSAKLVEEVETLFNGRVISGNERTSILTAIGRGQQKGRKQIFDDSAVAQKLTGNFPAIVLDPKQIDGYYERHLQAQVEALPPNQRIARQAEIITNLKAFPKQIKAQVNSFIASRSPDLISEAVALIDAVDEIPGITGELLDKNREAFARMVMDLSTNMDIEEAVAVAQQATGNKAVFDAKTQQIEDEKMQEDYSDIVESAFETPVFRRDFLVANVNKEVVEREYAGLFEGYFKAGMDKEQAEKKAVTRLQQNWKESQFGFMKHPPETYYTVAGNVDYMRDQLSRDVRDNFIGIEFEKKDLILFSDHLTARQADKNKLPSYRVGVIDSDGVLQILSFRDENGRLQGRWRPDMEAEQARQTKENQEAFDKGRAASTAEKKAEAFEVSNRFLESFKRL